MKLTNQELVEAQLALGKLNQVELPLKVSLELARLSQDIDQAAKAFAQVRDKLMQTYQIRAEQVGASDVFRFLCRDKGHEQENLTKFQGEFNELMALECDLNGRKPVRIPAEMNSKPILVPPGVIVPLLKLIEVV